MNKRRLWILSGLLTLAVVGLIIMQIYWVKNAFEIKEQQFRQLVFSTLEKVATKIEDKETVFYVYNQLDNKDESKEKKKIKGDIVYDEKGLIIHRLNRINEDGKPSLLLIDSIIIDMNPDDTTDPLKYDEKTLQNAKSNNLEYLENIMDQLYESDVSIENRITEEDVRTILRDEFTNSGISLEYEFSVMDDKRIVYQSQGFNPDYEKFIFRTKLFPKRIFKHESFLHVYFPEERNFLFLSLNLMVISSFILTIIIITLFSVTLAIIFKQKKLADIKNDFVNNMTHELKTPISTISLASQMMSDEKIKRDALDLNYIGSTIANESKRLSYLVEKVLQMAIFDKRKMILKFREVNMHELILNVIKNFSIQIKNKNGIFVPLLEARESILKGDEIHLINVVSNLIDNAIKFTPENPEIIISTKDDGRGLFLSVQDNGIGISKESHSKIFDRFYRVPTGNIHDAKGFGLGLTYVKTIVEEHKGTIFVDSEIQKGSTFTIFFPFNLK
ncbi:sensor histidine kinase [Bacteroidota bacterium]